MGLRMRRLWEGSSTVSGCYQTGNACVKALPASRAVGRHASEAATAADIGQRAVLAVSYCASDLTIGLLR